jgi:hypothetical protein
MKKVLLGVFLTIIGITTYLVFFPRVPEGKVVVSKVYLDSLAMIASQVPDTVEKSDTIWLKPDTVRVEKEPPIPIPVGEILAYSDSLVTPDLTVWLWDRIRRDGIIENRQWAYRLNLPYYVTREVSIYKPVPMPYPVIQKRRVMYKYYAQAGYDLRHGSLVFGGGVIRGSWMVGLEGGKDQLEVKAGIIF